MADRFQADTTSKEMEAEGAKERAKAAMINGCSRVLTTLLDSNISVYSDYILDNDHKRSHSTSLHTEIDAKSALKANADNNTTREEESDNRALHRLTMRSSEVTTTTTRLQCSQCVTVTTTGCGFATVVPKKRSTYDSIKAIKRFIVETGLQTTILQSDKEPATLELPSKVTKQIPHVRSQQVPHHSHQSQGTVERYHQMMFAQLRFCKDYNVDNGSISSHSSLLNHMLHHISWLLNMFLRHADGKASYERNWQRPYSHAILKFGEKVYIDNQNQRNSEQKYEAIYGLEDIRVQVNMLLRSHQSLERYYLEQFYDYLKNSSSTDHSCSGQWSYNQVGESTKEQTKHIPPQMYAQGNLGTNNHHTSRGSQLGG
eukprot:750093-Amphidinium_carterae.1